MPNFTQLTSTFVRELASNSLQYWRHPYFLSLSKHFVRHSTFLYLILETEITLFTTLRTPASSHSWTIFGTQFVTSRDIDLFSRFMSPPHEKTPLIGHALQSTGSENGTASKSKFSLSHSFSALSSSIQEHIGRIGMLGSMSIAVNSLTGPAMLNLPDTFQRSGLIPTSLTVIFVCILSAMCCLHMANTISKVRGNFDFKLEVRTDTMSLVLLFCDGDSFYFSAYVFRSNTVKLLNDFGVIEVLSSHKFFSFVALLVSTYLPLSIPRK